MIKIRKDLNLFLMFVILTVGIEAAGFGFRWLFGALGVFLQSPMWHGWFLAVLYCVAWLYAAMAYAVSWICMYAYIYGGIIFALWAIYSVAEKRQESKRQTFETIIRFQTRKLIKTFESDRGFGKQELRGFLNAVYAAILSHVRVKDIEGWVMESFSKNAQLKSVLKRKNFSIEYPRFGEPPALLIDGDLCPTH